MPTIASVEVSVHSVPFDGVAVRQGVGNMIKRDLVLVRIRTDDGTEGIGECHHGLNPTAVAEVVRHSMAGTLIGCDPHDMEGIWARIYNHQIRTHGLGAGSVIALSGIDIALWDLRGKLLGQPVWKLLGGSKKRMRAYAGGMGLGWQPPETLVEEVGKYVGQGYTAVKLRIGDNVTDDRARVMAVRDAFPDLDIAVDAATRYVPTQLPELVALAEDARVYWIEEPYAPDNLIAYAELREATRIPVAGGENHFLRQAFRDLFEARAIAIAQADCTKAGGISETKKIMEMAGAYHLLAAPHTSQSTISTSANVHLLCALPNALIYEADISALNPWRDELASDGLQVVDGHIEPSDAPGLGLTLNEEVLARYPAIPGPCYVPPWWRG